MEQPLDEGEPSVPLGARPRFRWAHVLLGVLLVALVAGAYWIKIRPGSEATRSTPAQTSQDVLMKTGLDLLYSRNDPARAAAHFRAVLALNPSHYGATYQLAVALDRSGQSAEARQYWEKMLRMAEATKDEPTLATVRKRLGSSPPTGADAVAATAMKAGLDALYSRNDPITAAAEFRKVLEQKPTHYGATYQLAAALDRAGKPAEARPVWEKVVKMAESYNDSNTLATARARLARKP